jgi:hypothetical protein
MEYPVNCKGAIHFSFLLIGTLVAAMLAALMLANSSLIGAALFGGFAVMAGMDLARTCYRVELLSEDELVLHQFLWLRVIRPASITSIELDEDSEGGQSTFVVVFDGGKFKVSANRSARRLVDALVRLEPTIAVSGYNPVRSRS